MVQSATRGNKQVEVLHSLKAAAASRRAVEATGGWEVGAPGKELQC